MNEENKTKQKPHLRILVYPEVCERCGKAASVLYLWNNRWLCKTCLEEEQQEWGVVSGGPSAGAHKVTYQKKSGVLNSIINTVLEKTGLARRKAESPITAESAVKTRSEKKAGKYKETAIFRYGRPLAEQAEGKAGESPELEGIRKPKKKSKRY